MESTLLYHGSNVVVETPKILYSKRALDFGAVFTCIQILSGEKVGK